MNTDKKVKSLFLGAKAENQDLYESIILETIRDNCFLRKNFHSEDKNIIQEKDKLDSDYQETVANFKQKMQEILADLKKGVPTYHPRYIGHMFGDLLLPAISAYFATMLYNPNNVVGECSPATTKMEFDYIRNLCRMIGYEGFEDLSTNKKEIGRNGITKIHQSWGHLCSGGSSANLEALWVARNMKYYPLSVKLAIDNPDQKLEDTDNEIADFFVELNKKYDVEFFSKRDEHVCNLSYKELFNMSVSDILSLKDTIYQKADDFFLEKHKNDTDIDRKEKDKTVFISNVRKRIDRCSVVEQGVFGIHSLIQKITNEEFLLPKLYITKSCHYSWDKTMDIIGIGRRNIVRVEMTPQFSFDINDLQGKGGKYNENKGYPILAVVGILGSTKQGSIDPMCDIVAFRERLEATEKKSFFFHIDGAFGGYFPSLLFRYPDNDKEEGIKNNKFGARYDLVTDVIQLKDYLKEGIKSTEIKDKIDKTADNLFQKLKNIDKADSYTIDPHKMGYVPYPAGSILYRDTRLKDFVSYEPSYLNKPSESDEYSAFLGQWTLEGSRPGAAAAACYMTNQLLPFNQSGYGLLIRNTVQMANTFASAIEKFNEVDNKDNRGYQIFSLYTPETNIVEYVLVNRIKIKKIEYLNILTKNIFEHFTVTGQTVIPAKNFFVAKEEFKNADIPTAIQAKLTAKDTVEAMEEFEDEQKLVILSSVFMNPLSIYIDDIEEYYTKFFKEMVEYADDIAMPDILFEQIKEKNNGERLKVLWIENEQNVEKLKQLVMFKSKVGQYLDIDFELYPNGKNCEKISEKCKEYKIIILDLNLENNHHNHTIDVTKENLQKSADFYNNLLEEKSKVILCSQFFNKEDTKMEAKKRLQEMITGGFTDESRMIPKPKKEDLKSLNPLINSIFNVFYNSKE